MPIDLIETSRGFVRGEFRDRYNAQCSIQKSSLATEDCVWLGCDHETIHETTGEKCGARMHLTRELAAELIPILQGFVETGELHAPAPASYDGST